MRFLLFLVPSLAWFGGSLLAQSSALGDALPSVSPAAHTVSLAAPAASAIQPVAVQGLSKTLYKDKVNGFRFRPPSKFLVVPSQPRFVEMGLLCRMDQEGGSAYVEVIRYEDGMFKERDKREREKEDKERDENETFVGKKRPDIAKELERRFDGSMRANRPKEEKKFKANGNECHWRVWSVRGYRLEVYSFAFPDADFHLLYFLDRQTDDSRDGKKWRSMFKKSGRSFDREEVMAAADTSKMSYKELLKYHKEANKQFKEWRVTGTPGKQFIVMTSSKRGAFIKNVIKRLERSRKLFERDFPPEAFGVEMGAISVVRVCGTEEEFHRYGNTSRGVGGWFNPASEELVLYSGKKDKEGDAETMAVMTHEAFHQYCHFLFQRSEAHRWFDEGHGDYYAATGWFEGKAYVKPEAPGGYNRLPRAKQLAERGEMQPLEKHLNFDHGNWQRRGLASYCQSWSIIYMLRQGSLGKVASQYWKKEYGEIIPNYMGTLFKEYSKAYAEELERREKEAKEEGRELRPQERQLDRSDIGKERRDEIWKKAMDASWGKVDLDEFERRWLEYVEHGI